MLRDIAREIKAARSIQPDAHATGNVEGDAVDCAGIEEVLVVLDAGIVGGTVNVHVEESANGSTGWADITGAAFTEVDSDNDDAVYQGRIKITPSRERYLRAYAVVATAAGDFSVLMVLGNAANQPVQTPAFDIHG
jgi:hypothetical protein